MHAVLVQNADLPPAKTPGGGGRAASHAGGFAGAASPRPPPRREGSVFGATSEELVAQLQLAHTLEAQEKKPLSACGARLRGEGARTPSGLVLCTPPHPRPAPRAAPQP